LYFGCKDFVALKNKTYGQFIRRMSSNNNSQRFSSGDNASFMRNSSSYIPAHSVSSGSSAPSADSAAAAAAAAYPPGSMSYVNLNINEYRIQDLEDFFTLPTKNYDIQDVVHKKKTMCASVDRDYTLKPDTRTNINSFLDQALARLVQHLMPITTGKPVMNLPTNTLIGDNGHFLIENPARDGIKHYDSSSKTGINLDDNGAPPGSINPLKINTIKRAVNIDTRFRPNYFTTKSSDIQINLPTKIERAISMRLASIEIPMTYYAINSDYGNNVFKVSWNSGALSCVITLPDGNYDIFDISQNKTKASSLMSAINAQLSVSTAYTSGLKLQYKIDVTSGKSIFYQEATATPNVFKLSFASDKAGVVLTGAANPLPFQGTLGWMLGFRDKTAEYISTGGAVGENGAGKVISEGICNVQGLRYIYVSIDDYVNSSNNYFVAAFANSIMAPNIIARINVAELSQSTTIYHYAQQEGYSTELDRSRTYFGPVDIQKMRVTLYDEYGRVVNLNSMDWSLELMFECIYA
jgi:hypothetical protein